MDRRQFLQASSVAFAALPVTACLARPASWSALPASAISKDASETFVNDVHSQLNSTHVAAVMKPNTVDQLRLAVQHARVSGTSVCIAGGRHAMGGQQFADAALLIDTRALNQVVAFDDVRGLITVEAGIQWPELLEYLNREQQGNAGRWGIYQKQTGADRLSLGGALACNAHGRGLTLKPIIDQVEQFDLLCADGEIRSCSRNEHQELFRLAIGGYGLFGAITQVQLRLMPSIKVRRVVSTGETATIAERFEERIRDGYLYGDYQFATDSARDSFLRRGVFSCYQPVPEETPLTVNPTRFRPEDWARLTYYSHRYKRRAFDIYRSRYLKTSGQIYWADSQLSAAYVDNYHAGLDQALGAKVTATEMIGELYVPRPTLAAFMEEAREALRQRNANLIYGTVRLIEQDDDSYLAWARQAFACIVFNLHLEHTPLAIEKGADTFRSLIDIAIAHRGSYYLTYHRWARKDQVEACYPQMAHFLALKRQYDPREVFQSNWYRHYRSMFV